MDYGKLGGIIGFHVCKFKHDGGFSLCLACNKWKHTVNFYHEGSWWTLCRADYEDYWYNTDERKEDFRGIITCKKCFPGLTIRSFEGG